MRPDGYDKANSCFLQFANAPKKLSRFRPLGLQEVEAPRMSTQSAHEGGKDVSPTHRPSSPPGDISGTHFCQRLSQAQGHSADGNIQYKIPMNPSGIEPATFRLVAHCLQQLRYRVRRLQNRVDTTARQDNACGMFTRSLKNQKKKQPTAFTAASENVK